MKLNNGALVIADIKNINFGDLVIFKSLNNQLLSEGYSQVYKLSNISGNQSETTWVKFYNPVSVLLAYSRSRSVYIGGGGIFQDDTSVYNLFFFGFFTFLAVLFRKHIVVKSVGVTPLNFYISKKIISFICAFSTSISVRDEESRMILKSLTGRAVVVEEDLALCYPFASGEENIRDSIKSIGQKRYIIVSLRPLIKKNEVDEGGFLLEFSKNLRKICDAYSSVPLFLPFCYEQDSVYIEAFVSNYFHGDLLYKSDFSVDEYAYLARNSVMLICMRLHAAILASHYPVPIYALSYNPKIEFFMRSIGRSDFCLELTGVGRLFEIVNGELEEAN